MDVSGKAKEAAILDQMIKDLSKERDDKYRESLIEDIHAAIAIGNENLIALACAQYLRNGDRMHIHARLRELHTMNLRLPFDLDKIGYFIEERYKFFEKYNLADVVFATTRYDCCSNGYFYRMS